MKYIIEGIDRLGKSTLIKNMLDELGYHLVVHYDKPKKLKAIENFDECAKFSKDPLKVYQEEVNYYMFDLLRTDIPIIFDRGHLGEVVYSPIYRKYSGAYVFGHEEELSEDQKKDVKLILLTTSNFDVLEDDGGGFDWNNKEKEQESFKVAFEASELNKVMVDICNSDGTRKTEECLLKEILK